jgi:hypothetical protein
VIIAANFTPVHKLAAAYLGARFMCVCVFLWQSRALDLHAGAFTINGAGETTAGGTYCGCARKNARAAPSLLYFMRGRSLARTRSAAPHHQTQLLRLFARDRFAGRIDSVGVLLVAIWVCAHSLSV